MSTNGNGKEDLHTADNHIMSYLHCGQCLNEFKEGAESTIGHSPQSYASYEFGWTEAGLQVWCKRHDCNVVHIDFEGQQHPAI